MTDVEIIHMRGYDFLWIGDTLMMWDIPGEHKAQMQIADQSYGDVLVAGYGLGIVQKYLLENPKVNSVLTVELLPAVIEANRDRYNRINGEITIADFATFESEKKFDCVIGDTWADIEEEALEEYNQFKAQAQKLVKEGGKILAWGQTFFEFLKQTNGMHS